MQDFRVFLHACYCLQEHWALPCSGCLIFATGCYCLSEHRALPCSPLLCYCLQEHQALPCSGRLIFGLEAFPGSAPSSTATSLIARCTSCTQLHVVL